MKARLPAGYGGGAPNNMNALARQAQKMQEEIQQITEELDAKEYTATAGGSAVSVTVTGSLEVRNITISPEVCDPEDTEMLGDLVMAAINEAVRQANEEKADRLGPLTNGLSIPGLF